jgi:DNA-binding NarL/FixJ family response regulator
MSIRVLLVDDHPLIRDGIRTLLEKDPGIQLTGAVGTAREAFQKVEKDPPDILLLDMELPDLAGPEVARQVLAAHPQLKILVLSAHDDKEYINELLKLGAAGYLIKDEAPELILDAIRGIAQGQQGWMSRQVTAQMSEILREEEIPDLLTPREKEVLRLVVAGRTNQAIGLELDVSEKTVEKHLESIFSKLNVASRVEAAVLAVREGLVD